MIRDPAVPAAHDAAAQFRAVIDRWHDRRPALDWTTTVDQLGTDGPGIEGRIAHLGLINCFQWHLEDECRAVYDQYDRMARIKVEIDRSNARRVHVVDDLDRLIVARLAAPGTGPARAGTRLVLTPPGHLLDRLSILELKRYHAGQRPAGDGRLVAVLSEQISDLAQGIDEVIVDVAAGVARLKLYPTVKMYAPAGGA